MTDSESRVFQVLQAWWIVPGMIRLEEGTALAVCFVLLSPIIVPVAALFYFSIPEEQRDLLEEWDDYS